MNSGTTKKAPVDDFLSCPGVYVLIDKINNNVISQCPQKQIRTILLNLHKKKQTVSVRPLLTTKSHSPVREVIPTSVSTYAFRFEGPRRECESAWGRNIPA
ncbi:hypothetical protein EVAR_2710_1 [Eumeta japonica]|uniref:Uncharacterized protein n=1 Tax=Eumeta variegata TaxID=151549 RepID=A0A4C1SM76_EUMVA|nr:hypothetical protein EVAR_2710_1 [Eumeta japonica]